MGAYGQAVSEHCLASLLALMKRLPLYRDNQRGHLWHDEGPVESLRGARVAVVGAGDLGLHFTQLCHALGTTCAAVLRHPGRDGSPEFQEAFSEDLPMGALPQALGQADVVACFWHLPATRGNVVRMALDNLRRYAAGEDLLNRRA